MNRESQVGLHIVGTDTGITRIQVTGWRQGSLTVSMWREGVFVFDRSDCKQVSGAVLIRWAWLIVCVEWKMESVLHEVKRIAEP